MGFIDGIKTWLKRDDEPNRNKTIDYKRRGKLSVVRRLCYSCGHNKAFYNDGVYKCTKCGEKVVL